MISELKRTNTRNNYKCYYCEPYDGISGKIPLKKSINLGILGDYIVETYVFNRRNQASILLQINAEKSRDQITIDLMDIEYCPFCGKKLTED